MKKIVIRIIIAIVVSFILSKLKLLNIMEVSALEVWNPSISALCYYNNPNQIVGCPGLEDYYINSATFKGSYYSTSNNFKSISFAVANVSSLNNKKFNASFIFGTTSRLVSGTYDLSQLQVYARDTQENISVCNISPVGSSDIGSWKFFTINCPGIFQASNTSIRYYISSSTTFETPGDMIISQITYVYDDDLLLAQQTANTRLQTLINSINSTNSKLDSLIQGILAGNGLQTQIQNNTKETNDLIKSDATIDNSKITDITNMDTNTSNTPVSDFITLPMTLLGKYKDGMNSSCSSVSFGSLFGTNLSLPCINIKNYIGDNLWSIIDMMCSLFMVYNIAMLCISIWEGITSLHDDFYGAYSPQHGVGGRVERGELGGLY